MSIDKKSSGKHNKKRNVGIIYSQLLRNISKCVVEDNSGEAERIVSIVKDKFRPGTELHKEFRLFNALSRTRVDDSSMATRIISEAKSAARDHDAEKLDREKSLLIKEINQTFDSRSFYNINVPEYRTFATIQTLLNDWRKDEVSNFERIANFEKTIHEHLLREESSEETLDKTPDVDSLTVKIMTKKLSDSFSPVLTSEQKNAIQKYILASSDRVEEKSFLYEMKEEKKSLLRALTNYSPNCKNEIISGQIPAIRESIDNFNPGKLDDSTVAKYLTMIKLRKELLEPEDD